MCPEAVIESIYFTKHGKSAETNWWLLGRKRPKAVKLCCFSFLLSSSANTGYHRRNIECASFQLVWKVSRFMIAFFLGSPKAYILVTKSNMEKKKKKKLLLPIKTAAWKGSASFLPAITSHLKLYVLLISYKKKHLCLFFFFTQHELKTISSPSR